MERTTLKEARMKKKLTQEEVAKHIGVTQEMYCMIEKGKRVPKLKQSKLLIKLLKINIKDL